MSAEDETPVPDAMTVPRVASHFKCSHDTITRLFNRGLLPEPTRIGTARVIPRSMLPTIEKALTQRIRRRRLETSSAK